ncbi:proline iminopeptidase-family hydrolase [Xanthovirga aplysinae]|uniref:proline iminopeptidase-family hydrolase n=1 Tax=Xanthovirga aplysinae TaxID=2529853 RepID=UPI0012BB4923|nr:proline iminopeptidase-family hydrolase [Xanthovirga aplysinae]MTI32523.1 alpha/beta fold hydrolase [Xanthovirga aplysinae]
MKYIKLKNRLGFLLSVVLIIINVSCQNEIEREGYVNVEGGKIWYKIVGEGDGVPLLVLHGGPGGRSCAMIPGFSLLATDRPVIFYDQLGSGNSDRPKDKTLWKVERFVNEIDYLRKALNLDELHILGHSFGSTFLIEYMITKKPEGVKSVIFSSPMISTSDWIADAKILLSQLPVNIQDTLKKYEVLKNYSAPAYVAATDSFYSRHIIRKKWLYKSTECENVGGFNKAIYNYMWGPTEFNATGTLLNFDRTSDLYKIEEPILFVSGEYDEARPETMFKYQKLSNNAIVEIIDDAGHATMIDQPEKLTEKIGKFLKNIDKN